MKKILITGVILIVGFFGILYFGDIFKINKEKEEFRSFRTFLNKEFFPIYNESYEHFNEAADQIEANNYSSWFLNNGLEENVAYQTRIEEAERKIQLEEVNEQQPIELKKNILIQITNLQETFEILYNAPPESDVSQFNDFKETFTSKITELSVLMEDMDKIINTYEETIK